MSRFSIPEATDAGIVLDSSAGLMWSAADVGDDEMTWQEATDACAKLNLGGFTDWRLPTVEELFPLADRSRYSPAIDTAFFPTCKSDWYWTASPVASNPDDAWIVGFDYGGAYLYYRGFQCRVRAVRSVARASQ
ncbi:DUF1566 domain-containing protein [Dokdonella soli]|uniref:Lcl C-terminal domain-containing protein n=1 Tax=Dokdonella soli TaxID=529810 RepID=A0ABN1IUD7_9GAMM